MKGKAKIDFEQWYNEGYGKEYRFHSLTEEPLYGELRWQRIDFFKLHPAMQQGVLLEYFRERGYDLQIRRNYRLLNEVVYQDSFFYEVLFNKEFLCESRPFPDYSTAFTHAIDKACDVYGGDK